MDIYYLIWNDKIWFMELGLVVFIESFFLLIYPLVFLFLNLGNPIKKKTAFISIPLISAYIFLSVLFGVLLYSDKIDFELNILLFNFSAILIFYGLNIVLIDEDIHVINFNYLIFLLISESFYSTPYFIQNLIEQFSNFSNDLLFVAIAFVFAFAFVAVDWKIFISNFKKNKFSDYRFSILLGVVAFSLFVDELLIYFLHKTSSILLETASLGVLLLIIVAFHFIAYGMLSQNVSQQEVSLVKRLWAEDKKQYRLQKESIEMINIKCHDLRHQIAALKNSSGEVSNKLIADMERSIDVTEYTFQTGNDVLNVIFSNIGIRCKQNGIDFSCMAEGSSLNFMEEMDIYSIFQNLLDNAFEYEDKYVEPDCKFISITVKNAGDMVQIHCENYCKAEIPKEQLEQGNIETTNEDKSNHGFGLKSIKNTTKKYGGDFRIFLQDDMFQVNIIFHLKGGIKHE